MRPGVVGGLPRAGCEAAADAGLEQPVPGRVVLDLVDAAAERVVGAQAGRVALDELGPAQRPGRARLPAEVPQPAHVRLGVVAPDRLDECGVVVEEVAVDRLRHEVEGIVRLGHGATVPRSGARRVETTDSGYNLT